MLPKDSGHSVLSVPARRPHTAITENTRLSGAHCSSRHRAYPQPWPISPHLHSARTMPSLIIAGARERRNIRLPATNLYVRAGHRPGILRFRLYKPINYLCSWLSAQSADRPKLDFKRSKLTDCR